MIISLTQVASYKRPGNLNIDNKGFWQLVAGNICCFHLSSSLIEACFASSQQPAASNIN